MFGCIFSYFTPDIMAIDMKIALFSHKFKKPGYYLEG
jgi:hypothetical protein